MSHSKAAQEVETLQDRSLKSLSILSSAPDYSTITLWCSIVDILKFKVQTLTPRKTPILWCSCNSKTSLHIRSLKSKSKLVLYEVRRKSKEAKISRRKYPYHVQAGIFWSLIVDAIWWSYLSHIIRMRIRKWERESVFKPQFKLLKSARGKSTGHFEELCE